MRVVAMATAIAVCTTAPRAFAQALRDSTPAQDVWLSGALGVGTIGLAADLSLWYTRAGLAIGVQGNADVGFPFGETRESLAFLVGASRDWGHDRLVGAIGPATLHSSVCGDDSGCRQGARYLALAFAGEAFVHAQAIGIGIDTFGAIAPKRKSHIGVGLSVQVGWLGATP